MSDYAGPVRGAETTSSASLRSQIETSRLTMTDACGKCDPRHAPASSRFSGAQKARPSPRPGRVSRCPGGIGRISLKTYIFKEVAALFVSPCLPFGPGSRNALTVNLVGHRTIGRLIYCDRFTERLEKNAPARTTGARGARHVRDSSTPGTLLVICSGKSRRPRRKVKTGGGRKKRSVFERPVR